MRTVKSGRVVALISFLLFFYGFYLGGLQLVIRQISQHFKMEITGIGILVAVPHITSLLLPPLMGSAADRVGKKPVLLCFAGVFLLGCLLCGFAGSISLYVAGALLIGGGCSVCESIGSAVLSDLSEENANRYINISQCLLSAGAVISPVILELLLPYLSWGWRTVFFLCAGAYLLVLLLLAKAVFPTPRSCVRTQTGNTPKFLTSPVLLCAMVSMALYVSLENGIGYFVESFFETALQKGSLGAYAISLYWIGMTLSRLVSGLWKRRTGTILRLHFGTSALLFLLLYLCPRAEFSMILCGLIGFAFGPIWGTLAAMGAGAFPEHSAKATGLISAFGSIGSTAAPVIMGLVADHSSIRSGFALLAGFALAGLLCCCFINRRKEIGQHPIRK